MSLITKKEIQPYILELDAFLKRNAHHQGTRLAENIIQEWLTNAVNTSAPTATQELLCEISFKGVTARDLLVRLGAIALFANRNQRRVPDLRSTVAAYGGVILRSVKIIGGRQASVAQKIKVKAIKDLGSYVNSRLGVYFINLCKGIQCEQSHIKSVNSILFSPFFPENLEQQLSSTQQ